MTSFPFRRFLLSLLLLVPGGLTAQVPPGWDASEFQISRQELRELLGRYESVMDSPGYSGSLKDEARRAAALIRSRLDEGDFRAGDRISVTLASDPTLFPDTLLVERGSVINLPNIGDISLYGVLRAELRDHLTSEISRFIRDPDLSVQSYVRLSVQGTVGRPGFYVFPAETLLGDVLMSAGGPTRDSELDKIRIRRGEDQLMGGEEVLAALDEGRSLDQLGLRAGDEINVPQKTSIGAWPTILRVAGGLVMALLVGRRIF